MNPKTKSPLDYILDRLDNPEFAGQIQSVLTGAVSDIESKTAHVETVISLSPSEEKQVSQLIHRRFPQTQNIDFRLNSDLLAGLRIRVGDFVLDSSLDSQLAALQKNII